MKSTRIAVCCIAIAAAILIFAHSVRAQETAPAQAPSPAPKAAVPESGDLKAAQKVVAQIYVDDISKARKPDLKAALAKKLLAAAQDTKDDPAGKYALLLMAADLATQAGDAETALDAVADEVHSFDVNAPKVKFDAVAKLQETVRAPGDQRMLIDELSGPIDQTVAANDYALARQLTDLAAACARTSKDDTLIKLTTIRAQDVRDIEAAFGQIKKHLATLADKPDDAEANLKVGRFYALLKGEWDKALPMLEASGDAALAPAAKKERAKPSDAEPQAALADAWYWLGDKETGLAQRQLRLHAADWYEKALPNLSGLAKARVDKRLQELDLLRMASDPNAIYRWIARALRDDKTAQTASAGATVGGRDFEDTPKQGAILVGFKFSLFSRRGVKRIRSVQPIFMTKDGETLGEIQGSEGNEEATVKAKNGYAVGGISVVTLGNFFASMDVTFMKISGMGLAATGTYHSDTIGTNPGYNGIKASTKTSGGIIVGTYGRSGSGVHALGLVEVKP